MKPKVIIKLAVDVLMTLGMLFLMGYHFWGEILHEWVGAGMFLLFILHHILNGYWYKSLFKRKYNALRILTLCIDLLVLISMMAQMYSGVLMSRYVFNFLPFNGGMSLVRRLHILGAYWGFLLMSLHLGLHWNMILGMFRKATGIKSKAKSRSMIAPELSRFHKFDSKGKVIGVRDMEIVDYIVENVSFFVRGEFQKCLL